MAEIWELVAVLAALYLWECGYWLPPDSLVICRTGSNGRILPALRLFGDLRPALFLADPRPWTEVYATTGAAGSDRSLDLEGMRGELARVRRAAGPLKVATTVLWLLVFVAGPGLVVLLGLAHAWPVWLLAVAAATIVVIALFDRSHRLLRPADRAARLQSEIVMLLLPLAAMRAVATLTLHAVEHHHPLVAAIALSRFEQWRPLGRRAVIDAGIRADTELAPGPRFAGLLEEAGISVAALLAAPAVRDPASRAYCPRCHAQYTIAEGPCVECREVLLVPFR